MSVPWFKWYPADWRADPQLRLCGLAARGLWIDLLGYMHEAVPYGFLLVNGEVPTAEEIADLAGVRSVKLIRESLSELERRQVFSRDEAGRIFSRRMVRDAERHLRDKAHGSQGGSPLLKAGVKEGVNPQVNATDKANAHTHTHTRDPEARNQRTTKPKAKPREPATPFAPPDWVPKDEWQAFDAMRKAKDGKAWTDDGRRFAVNTLEKLRDAGDSPEAVLRLSVERTWKGLFPLKKEQAPNGIVPEWWASEASTKEQGEKLGLRPRGGESWNDFRGRIREALRGTH